METEARGLHARAPEAGEVGRPQASLRRNSCALTGHPRQPTPHPHPDSLLGKRPDRVDSGEDHPYGARGARRRSHSVGPAPSTAWSCSSPRDLGKTEGKARGPCPQKCRRVPWK